MAAVRSTFSRCGARPKWWQRSKRKPLAPTREVLLYRVFPFLESASNPTEPGHPLHVHPVQGGGRWDNPNLYLVRYLSTSAEGAVGETFGGVGSWSSAMLASPHLPGS